MNINKFKTPTMASDPFKDASEIIPGRLYYSGVRQMPANTADRIHFTIDADLCYEPFYADFGPLNLAMLFKFCKHLVSILEDPENKGKKVYYCSSFEVHKRANAAYLISCFALLYLHKTPEEAYAMIDSFAASLVPFRDASYGGCTYKLTVMDCLRGLNQALAHGFVNFDTFNVNEYQFYERVENGDFNWIIPDKFLAFAGPHNQRRLDRGYPLLAPEDYFDYFRSHGVTDVVRLNKKEYEGTRFSKAGFKHHELFFIDGSKPPEPILREFLKLAESAKGVCAVHCKAGLGRTGSLIACYMMKHYKFTSREAIAWLRISRPGSVIGPQQYYLGDMQPIMWEEGQGIGCERREGPLEYPEWTKPLFDESGKLASDLDVLKLDRPVASATAPRTPEQHHSAVPPPLHNKSHPSSRQVLIDETAEVDGMSQGDLLNQQKLRSRGRPVNLEERLAAV